MEINRVEGYRKFCNKLWNATKFCLFRLGLVELDGTRLQSTFTPHTSSLPTGEESLAEKWLFHKLNIASKAVNEALEKREFSDASSAAHHFFLYDLCDVFIVSTTQ
jgi:valyl-tRNA synthetase